MLPRTLTAAALVLMLVGCAKHKCKLDTDGKKAAFGDVAEMTKGAHSCAVEGTSKLAGVSCTIGDASCMPTMRTIHGNMQHDAVAKQYATFLEAAGWKVVQKPYDGKRANGKTFTGTQVRAEKGDRVLLTRVYMLADTLAEANTMAVDRSLVLDD